MNAAPRKDIHNSDIPLVCVSCEARHKGVCGALNSKQLSELAKHTSKVTFNAEQPITSDGEQIRRYGNILSGVVKLAKLTSDGRQQIVGLQFAPDFVGRPFSEKSDYDVEAATEVHVCTFPPQILNRLVQESPELEHRLHEQTLKELDEARDWMLTLGRKSAGERVASFLHFIAQHVDPDLHKRGPVTFELPLKRTDMADFLGLTIETVSRQLTKLRQARIIELPNNRTVVIADVSRLKAAADKQDI
ncbi:MAG: Crp/Fnr family transcriptional regulator [Alphaproteobacteria bacterium]|nr:Crp/Fnr family transcriptional regulator [Alphaproteobacteria bacterium]